jgi:XTP/dITP diphosphohydrolase
MKIVFATNNKHKLSEISRMVPQRFTLLGLADINIFEDIPEDADNLADNALQKARFVHSRTGMNVFADDTGLEVEALNGRPGVYSARYAGEGCSFDDNMDKLLGEMEKMENRNARFRTVIALILEDKEYLFEGIADGRITREKSGEAGFGYDPIFVSDGMDLTFAEIDPELKNRISHRGRATEKLIAFLDNYSQQQKQG